jgi:hypothetical protein
MHVEADCNRVGESPNDSDRSHHALAPTMTAIPASAIRITTWADQPLRRGPVQEMTMIGTLLVRAVAP